MGTLAPDHILHELSDLWVSLGKQGQEESGAGVLRACSMTLIVVAEENEDFASLGETLAALMPEHPARSILIRLRGAGPRELSERVYAQCWMPFGQRRQICCEQIEISATDAALADLPPVVVPLAVPDLPVIVWCRSARLIEMREFAELAANARKVILDSAAMHEPRAGLRRLAEASRGGLLLGDLAWTRLTRWREMLAQVFENRKYLARLPAISRVRVLFESSEEIPARYLGAWLTSVLPSAGAAPTLEMQPGHELQVQLSGEGIELQLQRKNGTLTVSVDGFKDCAKLPPAGDYNLMREELRILRHDHIFEKALASAAALAYPTDK